MRKTKITMPKPKNPWKITIKKKKVPPKRKMYT